MDSTHQILQDDAENPALENMDNIGTPILQSIMDSDKVCPNQQNQPQFDVSLQHQHNPILQCKKIQAQFLHGRSRFVGVVRQTSQAGKWGAQIYKGHTRSWLGTFNSPEEAALAYDIACLKMKGTTMNFTMDHFTNKEILFINLLDDKTLVTMLQRHSYHHNLIQSWDALDPLTHVGGMPLPLPLPSDPVGYVDPVKTYMFEKVLTHSDVGQLNRLLIPKTYAIAHFPAHELKTHENRVGVTIVDSETAKEYLCSFCLWGSCQSYVLKSGWSVYVKAKGLNAGDIVMFTKHHASPPLTYHVSTYYKSTQTLDSGNPVDFEFGESSMVPKQENINLDSRAGKCLLPNSEFSICRDDDKGNMYVDYFPSHENLVRNSDCCASYTNPFQSSGGSFLSGSEQSLSDIKMENEGSSLTFDIKPDYTQKSHHIRIFGKEIVCSAARIPKEECPKPSATNEHEEFEEDCLLCD